MSRRSQDIPIRPRYGLTEMNEESSEGFEQRQKPRRAHSNVGAAGGSSYSEIPFLAQYTGAVPVPQQALGDATPTEEVAGAHGDCMNYRNKHKLDYDDDDDDDDIDDIDNDDDDNSKDSSTDAESHKKHKRPNSLHYDSSFPYELDRTTSTDGEIRHFAAGNIDDQLRTMSPRSRRGDQMTFASHNSTPSTSTAGSMLTRHFLQTQQPQIDANVLSDIEIEAQYLAASVDNLIENLSNLLHSISSITADNVEVHRNAVNKLTDSMDANIKCMYTIMAKTEEITKSMKPTEQLGQRIREIKRLVDMLETTM